MLQLQLQPLSLYSTCEVDMLLMTDETEFKCLLLYEFIHLKQVELFCQPSMWRYCS